MRRAKFGNVKTVVDGFTFASKREANRYGELVILLRAKKIADLELQVPFDIRAGDVLICKYVADFCYRENGKLVVEDAKGVRTPVYKLKKKLLAAQGIEIREV